MRIKPLHKNFIMPTKSTEGAGAYDIYMPEAGSVNGTDDNFFPLGFSTAIPVNHVALILPRSGVGAKKTLELNNSCGVIDSDFRGEWQAALRTKTGKHFNWESGERLLQFLIVPVLSVNLELVDELEDTSRDNAGFGSSGK